MSLWAVGIPALQGKPGHRFRKERGAERSNEYRKTVPRRKALVSSVEEAVNGWALGGCKCSGRVARGIQLACRFAAPLPVTVELAARGTDECGKADAYLNRRGGDPQ